MVEEPKKEAASQQSKAIGHDPRAWLSEKSMNISAIFAGCWNSAFRRFSGDNYS